MATISAEPITVLATQAIANIIKSSFGPSGLDKMMVDDIGVSSCVQLVYKTETRANELFMDRMLQ